MQRNIRWALVGLGAQGARLADAINEAEGHAITALVCDDAQHASVFAKSKADAPIYDSVSQLLGKGKNSFDAAVIATKNDEHARQCLALLKADKDILCEKPATVTLKDARAVARAAAKAGVIMQIDFQLRHTGAAREARRIIASGALGTIIHIDAQWSIGKWGIETLPPLPPHMAWREKRASAGGGAIMARGVHLFDIVRFVTGLEYESVSAFSDATRLSDDRTLIASAKMSEGALAQFITSKRLPVPDNRIIISGSLGKLTLRIFDQDEIIHDSASGPIAQKFPIVNLYAAAFEDFARSRNGEETFGATMRDGLISVAVTEALLLADSRGITKKIRV